MGIHVEFNPDLALRDIEEFKSGARQESECIPEPLEIGKTYPFLKRGQRNYWFFGEIPLLRTKGEGDLSMPIASIVIKNANHILLNGGVWTSGEYKVVEVFKDDSPRFNGFAKI